MSPAPDAQTSPPSKSPNTGALPLRNSRWEAFAQRKAAGLNSAAAYRRSGYANNRKGASGLAKKPPVVARIAWLKAQAKQAAGSDSEFSIVRLLDMADAADLTTAAGVREAREALEQAWRLYVELCKTRTSVDAAG